jgi:two-component system, chemotaxis family, CheB/CheR fusion protein
MSANDANSTMQFEALLDYVLKSRGFDFTAYKRSSLERRVQKRMQVANVEDYGGYCDYLEAHPSEFTLLFNTILINVTNFFRDPEAWEYLAADIIPRVLQSLEGDAFVRVWSAGCSSGEEPFSLAMLLAEALGLDAFRERVKIYATDVDEEALSQGRQASYSEHAIGAVPLALVEKYFEKSNGAYALNRDLRRSVIFGRHDLIVDPPISRVSLLACRNTLMYFNSEVQQRILGRFHFGLRDGGYLFLGKAEMLLTRSSVFSPVDLKRRVFTKLLMLQNRNGVVMAAPRGNDARNRSRDDNLRDLSFHLDPTAQIVINPDSAIAATNERARTLFGLAANDVGRPLQDLEVSYRPAELRSLVEQAAAERRTVTVKDVEFLVPSGERIFFDVQIIPVLDAALDVLGTKILFRDVTRYHRLEDDLKTSHQELETANEELQSTNEELETTNEELQSTVEELETTNEELQSTNEELETMNEELQSTNEELQTANDQLRHSSDELNRANAFLENVLSNFREGVVVVDGDLRVQAWNTRAEDLWGLRSAEVVGKHLMNLDLGLPVENLRQPLRRCLSGESPFERVTLQATNRRGRSIEVAVSCTAFTLGKNGWGAIVMMDDKSRPATPLD